MLLDQLGIEQTALVAQSMGGRSALGFAVRYPKRVRALVLADTMAGIVWPEMNERILEARAGVDGPLAVIAVGQKFQEREPARTFLYRQIASLNPPDA